MGEIKLERAIKFSKDDIVSTDLYESQKVCCRLLCMEEGQSALEDTKEKKIIIIIHSGSGSVVTDDGERDVEEGVLVLFESNESRLLKAKTRLTALVASLSKG